MAVLRTFSMVTSAFVASHLLPAESAACSLQAAGSAHPSTATRALSSPVPGVMTAYKRGPRASNFDRVTCSSPGTLEQAQAMCNADRSCRSLHDFNCDGTNWRHCSAAVGDLSTGDASACTMEPVRVIYESGTMVDNYAFVNHNCSSPVGTREQAQAMCNADPSCTSLHDWNCDDANWRYCTSAVGEAAVGDGGACTMERVEVAPAAPCLGDASSFSVPGAHIPGYAFDFTCGGLPNLVLGFSLSPQQMRQLCDQAAFDPNQQLYAQQVCSECGSCSDSLTPCMGDASSFSVPSARIPGYVFDFTCGGLPNMVLGFSLSPQQMRQICDQAAFDPNQQLYAQQVCSECGSCFNSPLATLAPTSR